MGETGSGTAIGVAIIFPMLMAVIVAIAAVTSVSRMEQSLQATADRAARTASLCCYYTGGPNGAQAVAHSSLAAAELSAFANRVTCSNDLVGDSGIEIRSVGDDVVPIAPDAQVPPGGTVYVYVTCDLPPSVIGGFGLPLLKVERRALGIAVVDPYRYRPAA